MFIYPSKAKLPGVPDLKKSNATSFILIIKRLFLLKPAIIRINFDIFCSIINDSVVKLKISKFQNCPEIKTRAAAFVVKLPSKIVKDDIPSNYRRLLGKHASTRGDLSLHRHFLKISVKAQLLFPK